MVARRPVCVVSGKKRQLPVGDSLLGVPVYLPAYQATGLMLKVAIASVSMSLTVNRQAGGSLAVGVALNG